MPFDNSDGRGFDRSYPCEVDPELPAYRDGDRQLSWELLGNHNCFGYVDLEQAPAVSTLDATQSALLVVAYARCFVWSPDRREAYARCAAEPNIAIWINGTEFHRHDGIELMQRLPQPVLLEEGWNSILIKVAKNETREKGGRRFGYNFTLVDAENRPIEDLLYSAAR